MDWKAKTMAMWRDGKSRSQMVEALRDCFPGKTDIQVQEKIRSYLRGTPEYKERNRIENQAENRCTIEYRQDGTLVQDKLIEICEGEELTPENTIKAHGLDPARWEVLSYRNNYWHSQIKGGKRLVMYQSRLTVKPANNLSIEAINKHFAKLDRTIKPIPVSYKPSPKGLTAEVNITDLHLGKLCWHGDTGNNFDYKIARQLFRDVISDIAQTLPTVDKIVFVWSHDYFNSDTVQKTTTAGTPQDTDVRWQKLFDVGVELLVEAMLTFRELAPVETFFLPSNHDTITAYHAIKYLEAFFRNDDCVTVITDPKARKYALYGNTLIGYVHGDKCKAQTLAALMPVEAPELWAKAKYREIHTGHLHSEQAIVETNGVIVRRLSALTASDTWHFESGLIGAQRKAQTFIYDPEKGITHIIHTSA